MIIGIGTDVARINRFEKAMARHGERFAERILGCEERLAFRRRGQTAGFLAKRFAAKEAFVKALGTGLRHGISWHDVQVTNDALGRPMFVLSGVAQRMVTDIGITALHLSLSDESDVAIAFVVLEG